jgi:hypothetical protein
MKFSFFAARRISSIENKIAMLVNSRTLSETQLETSVLLSGAGQPSPNRGMHQEPVAGANQRHDDGQDQRIVPSPC